MIDIAIIGAGPAGMTAGMYAARAGLRPIIVEKVFPGGQLATAVTVENYPGFPGGIGGPELVAKMSAQADEFGVETAYGEPESLELSGAVKRIILPDRTIEARAVILAMGATSRTLGVPGESRLRGRGVSYCATCDGSLFRGKRVAVIGGGDTAAEDAAYLAQLGSEVLLVHRRDRLRAQDVLAKRLLSLPNVRPIWNARVEEILGDEAVRAIRLDVDGQAREEAVDAVFVAIGTVPSTDIVKGLVALDEGGYVLAGEDTRTSLPGVYAAGDLRQKPLRQIVTAVSDAATAVYSAIADFYGAGG